MKSVIEQIFSPPDQSRIACTITQRRGTGSYVVQDDMGRRFIVSGGQGLKKLQKVVVIGGEIVGSGLEIRNINRVSV